MTDSEVLPSFVCYVANVTFCVSAFHNNFFVHVGKTSPLLIRKISFMCKKQLLPTAQQKWWIHSNLQLSDFNNKLFEKYFKCKVINEDVNS